MFYIAIMLMGRIMRTSSGEVIGCLMSESCFCSFLFKLSKTMKIGLLELLAFTRTLVLSTGKCLFSLFVFWYIGAGNVF